MSATRLLLLGATPNIALPLEVDLEEAAPSPNPHYKLLKNTAICALSLLISVIAITSIGATFAVDSRRKESFEVVALAASAFAIAIIILCLSNRNCRRA